MTIRYADGHLPRVTISAGVAALPDAGSNLMEVLRVADDALYRAKQSGRNRVEMAGGAAPELDAEKAADKAVAALGAVLEQAGQQDADGENTGEGGRSAGHRKSKAA